MGADLTQDGPRRHRTTPGFCRQLRIVHGPSCGGTIELNESGSVVVGRSIGKAGVVLADPRASRVHFEIIPTRHSTGFKIRDLDSHNGTRHNGKLIRVAPLSNGDVIRAGDSLLVYCERDVKGRIDRFVKRAAGSDMHLLILGESGVGKEVLARRIHDISARKGPFVAVNCAAVPHDLLVSELFGHTRGAFSGAQQSREGLFTSARGGTLMLDEIGDMAVALQPALLRVLETRAVRPVGGDREHPIDVRIIAATNLDPCELVEKGKFRGDLYARIAQLVIDLPPLRARKDEILELAWMFGSDGNPQWAVDADVAEALLLWDWPYNVRELKSVIKALQTSAEDGRAVQFGQLIELRPEIAVSVESTRFPAIQTESSSDILTDRDRLADALRAVDGNIAALARKLATSRSQVYRWLRRWNLPRTP